jgi:hypothetical protein
VQQVIHEKTGAACAINSIISNRYRLKMLIFTAQAAHFFTYAMAMLGR